MATFLGLAASVACVGLSPLARCCEESDAACLLIDSPSFVSADSSAGRGQALLQVSVRQGSHGAEHPSAPAEEASPWHDWTSRVQLFNASALNPSDVSPFVQAWTMLGDGFWMEFLDGKDHKDGPHSYDNQVDKGRNVGSFFEGISREYSDWSHNESWTRRWNASGLAFLNARYNGKQCKELDCFDMFQCSWSKPGCYSPRQGATTEWFSTSHVINTSSTSLPTDAETMRSAMSAVLDTYYTAIDAFRDDGEEIGLNARLLHGLPHLAELYAWLAELHPFYDGNSRVRTLVLQTELVRLGGHPVVMKDNAWAVYYCNSMDDFLLQIKNGWCNWESVAATGTSPFLTSMNISTYEPLSGACNLAEI
jgi:hypothetical protein